MKVVGSSPTGSTKIITIKSGLCSECYIKQSYRTKEKPSKEELESLLKQYSLNKIGKMYGVTHNVVKKWGINYNLINL